MGANTSRVPNALRSALFIKWAGRTHGTNPPSERIAGVGAVVEFSFGKSKWTSGGDDKCLHDEALAQQLQAAEDARILELGTAVQIYLVKYRIINNLYADEAAGI
jgi:hypothetical protein